MNNLMRLIVVFRAYTVQVIQYRLPRTVDIHCVKHTHIPVHGAAPPAHFGITDIHIIFTYRNDNRAGNDICTF